MQNNKERKPLGFWKTVLASATGLVIGTVVLSFISFVVTVIMLVSMLSVDSNGETVKGDHLFIEVDVTDAVVDRTPDKFASLFTQTRSVSLTDLVKAVRHAADDDRVSGIYLHCGGISTLSWAQGDELRDALLYFRHTSGKPVIAYGDSYTQSQYYLATASDRIAMHPAGIVDLRGIGAEVLFYKELLDKLGVSVDLIRPQNNEYKSAGETFTRSAMSEANREQIRSYIGSIWQIAVDSIGSARHIATQELNGMADTLAGYLSSDAVANRLIDTLLFETDIHQMIKSEYEGKKIVDASRYAQSQPAHSHTNKIAIVYAEGNVVDGTSQGLDVNIYSDEIVKALQRASKNKHVKAIVLRINSPGGSATASEAITHAVIEANKEKPVVVSMSTLAASAGYEIASNASYIVAEPNTLTGSIGVFATIPEVGGLLRKKLGITTDTVGTNANSNGLSLMRPLSPAARSAMQRNVETFYRTFCQRVADGRGMTADAVNAIGRGRVWTGRQAVEIGLVDTLGGLHLALEIAAQKAGIQQYATVDYPQREEWFTQLMKSANGREDIVLSKRMGSVIPYYDDLRYWSTMEPLQARIPYLIVLQ
mgnify:CR=1 FL=1